MEDSYTACGQCGNCWFPFMSLDIVNIGFDRLREGLTFALTVHYIAFALGKPRYSTHDTVVSCRGQIKLGLVGLDDRRMRTLVRALYPDEFDSSDMLALRARCLADVGDQGRVGAVPFHELVVLLFQCWNDYRSLATSFQYRSKLDPVSERLLLELQQRKVPAEQCLSLATVDRFCVAQL
jgi:hypothetical protein